MRFVALSVFAGMLIGLSSAGALSGEYGAYRDGYARYWDSYERGYHGEPRFYRGFHDDVRDYGYRDWHDDEGPGYLPPSPGLYSEDRGYGVEGRGWQLP
jgi:hypothetical protein